MHLYRLFGSTIYGNMVMIDDGHRRHRQWAFNNLLLATSKLLIICFVVL